MKRRATSLALAALLAGPAGALQPSRPGNARAPAAEAPHAAPLEAAQLAEELAVDTPYWHDPRIHSMGNVGAGGLVASVLGPLITKLIDVAAYDGRDIRAETALSVRAALAASLASVAPAGGALSASYDTVVDVGCGTGASTRGLRDAFPGATIHALDTSPNFLAAARATTLGARNVKFAEANGERTGLAASSADVVSIQFVLHEAPADGRRKLLAEARRLLKPGGVLVVLDIAQEYEPSDAMAHGEPFVHGYLKYIDRDVHAAGFSAVERTKVVPGHATMWLCQKDPRPALIATAKNNVLKIKLPTGPLIERDASVPANHLRVEHEASTS